MSLRIRTLSVVLGASALLAGCASKAPHYYSLQAPAMAATVQEPQLAPDYVISVQPVLIPEQLARPQIVIAKEAGTEVVPLNAALWAGPLETQIRDSLADSLARHLNVLDVGLSKNMELPTWLVYVDVQRFDSLYGESVRQDLVWRLVPQGMPASVGKRVCSAQLQLPVGNGMSALVEGHRRSLDALAAVMARTIPATGGAAAASIPVAETDDLKFRGCVG